MRFGINTFLFAFPFTNGSATLFPQFKKWGFDTVEVAIDDPAGYDPKVIRAALDNAGLACGSVCGAFGPDRDLRGTPDQQQTSLDYQMRMQLASGDLIPIEERKPEEVTEGFGRRTVPQGVAVYNPAFDVTPHRYVAGFITEKGLIRPPFDAGLKRLFGL